MLNMLKYEAMNCKPRETADDAVTTTTTTTMSSSFVDLDLHPHGANQRCCNHAGCHTHVHRSLWLLKYLSKSIFSVLKSKRAELYNCYTTRVPRWRIRDRPLSFSFIGVVWVWRRTARTWHTECRSSDWIRWYCVLQGYFLDPHELNIYHIFLINF